MPLLNDIERTQIKRNPGHKRYVSQGQLYILGTVHHYINVPKTFYSYFLVVTNDKKNLIRAREPLVVEKVGVTRTVDGCSVIFNQYLTPRPFRLPKTTPNRKCIPLA